MKLVDLIIVCSKSILSSMLLHKIGDKKWESPSASVSNSSTLDQGSLVRIDFEPSEKGLPFFFVSFTLHSGKLTWFT